MIPEPLEFERHSDQCCQLCNPLSYADFETTCIAVRRPGGNRLYVCRECVTLMARAARTGKTQSNGQVRASIQASLERRYGPMGPAGKR